MDIQNYSYVSWSVRLRCTWRKNMYEDGELFLTKSTLVGQEDDKETTKITVNYKTIQIGTKTRELRCMLSINVEKLIKLL